MKKLILHIPHSSLTVPLKDGYLVGDDVLEQEQLILTDWYTDNLFQFEAGIPIIADFSRIFCDVERFSDDSLEIMSKEGMGVLYERRDNGDILREINKPLREKILNDFYFVHHKRLTSEVNKQLKENGRALIIDCHSYPDKPMKRDLIKNPTRPDYNIGTDKFHTSDDLKNKAKQFFDERKLSLGIDTPYAGSIVPTEYYQKEKRVQSIMLEINRKLYLKDGTNLKSEKYQEVKQTVKDFLKFMSENCL